MHVDFLLAGFSRVKNNLAAVCSGQEFSYGGLLSCYHKWAKSLKDSGFKGGEVTAVRAEFSIDSIALLTALMEIGAILVPISAAVKNIDELYSIAEVEWEIDLLADGILRRSKRKAANKLLVELKASGRPGLVLFSSGTIGKQKGSLHDLSLLLEKFKKPGRPMKTVTFLLFDHIGGFNTLFHVLSTGGTLFTLEARTTDEICRVIEKHKVELLPTSPTFINMLLFSKAYEKYDLSSLKLITYGTEPMPERTLAAISAALPLVKLKQTYGLSEIGIMSSKSESSASLWIKLGGEGYESKIIDGVLWIRARSAMLGYLNAPSPFDSDGWFNTCDRVEVKGEFMRILGRQTDIINVGGQKVYPAEVESALLEIVGVKDAAVSGEKHALMGQIVTAKVMVDSVNNNKDFIRCLKMELAKKLDKFKIPVKVNLTTELFVSSRFKRER